MFKPSIIHHRCGRTPPREMLQQDFGLLCLNTHKNNQRAAFQRFFRAQTHHLPLDIVLFQEAAFSGEDFFLDQFCYEAAPNLQVKGRYYGVLNASDTRVLDASPLLSFTQEVFIKTHKSALITYYPLPGATHDASTDSHSLCVANIHAINFKGLKEYQAEVSLLAEALCHHRGPMIVAGDFNSWSTRRELTLQQFCHALELRPIHFQHPHLIKRFMGHPLDHIFYRGLSLHHASCLSSSRFSDHNMLYAQFRLDTRQHLLHFN
ncbi:endonuclease/exonuclease/phosphatase family protein [Pokkaliibacter plantistimulans]|nr:endonuclease/exonuclease/phosphatase family protein [Pokkaliibacter plantistimulans]PPC75489.1 endonuclease/exonuclease/phosphatase family protein [Pokkaliibacter plantistimulans]